MGLFARRKSRTSAPPGQQVVERYIREAFLGGSTEALDATVSKDCPLRQILPIFWNAFADRKGTINRIFTSADGQFVADNFTFEGRHVGPWLDIQPTGKTVTLDVTAMWRLADGKIDDFWLTWDWMPLLEAARGGA